MNSIVKFRKCTLSHKQLIETVDEAVDFMYLSGKIPDRYIPARPDEDYDLITGELIYRFDKAVELLTKAKDETKRTCDSLNIENYDLIQELEAFLLNCV